MKTWGHLFKSYQEFQDGGSMVLDPMRDPLEYIFDFMLHQQESSPIHPFLIPSGKRQHAQSASFEESLINVIIFLMLQVGFSGKTGDNAECGKAGEPSFMTPRMEREQKQLPESLEEDCRGKAP